MLAQVACILLSTWLHRHEHGCDVKGELARQLPVSVWRSAKDRADLLPLANCPRPLRQKYNLL